MNALEDFYDPELYELNVGHAPRVGGTYEDHLVDLPQASRVMELGCGIGDVLLPLARRGAVVVGVDRSPQMLAHFARRVAAEAAEVADRIRLMEESLPDIPVVAPVDALLMPNDLVSHILDDGQLVTLFENARRVLNPGGDLLLDVARFDVVFLGSITGTKGALTRTHGFFEYPGDCLLRIDEQSTYSSSSGLITSTFRYEILDSGAVVKSTRYRVLRMCPRRVREITAALELAGFEIGLVADDALPAGIDHVFVAARPGRAR